MLTCMIIDDEQHAIDNLKKYIETVPYLNLIRCFTNPLEALRTLKAGEDVDLIFLDIDMPQMTGIELAKEIRHKTKKLIITTGYQDYAFEAFEVKAEKYLLKPFSLGKFHAAINDIFESGIDMKIATKEKEADKDFMFVKRKGETHNIIKVMYDEILMIESCQNYLKIHIKDDIVIAYGAIGDIIVLLKNINKSFIRIHRAFIINAKKIDSVKGKTVELLYNLQAPVGKSYRDELNKFIKNQMLYK